MEVRGYVRYVEKKVSQGKDGTEYVKNYLVVEGMRLGLASKNIPIPEENRRISAIVTVEWHKNYDGKHWSSVSCEGWEYLPCE